MIVILHGILGASGNWRSFAARLQRRRADLSVVLVDLRHHGRSPHPIGKSDLQACAFDLVELQEKLMVEGLPLFDAIVGHSFGGKVALAALQPTLIDSFPGLSELWTLDSSPGPLSDLPEDRHEVARVISALRQIPMPLSDRKALLTLLPEQGFSVAIAKWMTTNLRRESNDDIFNWRFNLDGVEEMIADYFAQDYWPLLEHSPQITRHVLRAERSNRWSDDAIAALERLDREQHAFHSHLLVQAGHWVHVDNPEGLLELMTERLLN